ncbi:MAG: phenylalanine--tRNA ligase subunit alpha [Gemmatimonadetes bacterium]|nr:phenylalanine--tRNA ligase subunit alpha [Gemmatimonadota bacterium]
MTERTPSLLDELKRLEVEALSAVAAAHSAADLEAVRVEYLGRQDGKVSRVLRGLGALAADARPAVGAEANRVKGVVQDALECRKPELAGTGAWAAPAYDLTLPGRRPWLGARHPVTRVVDEISGIFKEMGFTRVRGPEAETEWYNFVALNTPLDHPAADAQDTLYLDASPAHSGAPGSQLLLRSHTSPVQIRTMETHAPPIRVIAPGWVYRRDTYDPTHTPAFLQIEGLAVDEGITFVDLKATLAEFARRFFGAGTQVRFRPSFFPFTEPSAEVDVKRVYTRADGVRVETDWLEIMGAGMVDPAVLANVGYDPERYTGWAFGMGPARIALLRYGVPDLRMFFDSDMRLLAQLSGSGA